jgi:SAM-dependent methyltransferase
MEPIEYRNIFENEASHWWYRGLRKLVCRYISRRAQEHGAFTLLDAGCGAGMLLHDVGHLPQCRHAIGIDVSPFSIAYCRQRCLKNIGRASVTSLPFKPASFDVVTSLDVIYHRQVVEDVTALREFYRVLRPGGTLILNLPAMERLRSPHDRVVHTKIRYSRTDLENKLRQANFTIAKISYRNALLFPVVLLVRWWKNFSSDKQHHKDKTGTSDVTRVSFPVNQFLYAILCVENGLFPCCSFPFGSSLFCVADKA